MHSSSVRRSRFDGQRDRDAPDPARRVIDDHQVQAVEQPPQLGVRIALERVAEHRQPVEQRSDRVGVWWCGGWPGR